MKGFLQILASFIMILSAVMLSACSAEGLPTPVPEIPVDAVFKEYYASLGGRSNLGLITHPAFDLEELNKKCQYTSNALMCLNLFETDPTRRFSLYPIGATLNLHDEPDAPNGAADGQRVVNGYILYPTFAQLYDGLKGEQTAGRALTRARYNYLQRRIEQYFENIGFFQSLDDPSGRVCLLAYGTYACRESCQIPPADPCLGIIDPNQQQVEQPFLEGLVNNNLLTVGQPLSQAYPGEDSLTRQVYEAAVVYSPSGSGADIRLLPLPVMLGLAVDEPQAPTGTSTSQYIFYPTRNELGYYVLVDFDQFIQTHGGAVFSGAPISNVQPLDRGVMRQCFENYCLEYTPAASIYMRVHMVALGIQYLQTNPLDSSLMTAPLYSAETIDLQASAERSSLNKNDPQTFRVQISDRQKGTPLVGVTASLRLVLPDTTEMYLEFPPADAHGQAELTIDPLPNMENGGIVPYHVCLNLSSPQPICSSKSYMVWNYR